MYSKPYVHPPPTITHEPWSHLLVCVLCFVCTIAFFIGSTVVVQSWIFCVLCRVFCVLCFVVLFCSFVRICYSFCPYYLYFEKNKHAKRKTQNHQKEGKNLEVTFVLTPFCTVLTSRKGVCVRVVFRAAFFSFLFFSSRNVISNVSVKKNLWYRHVYDHVVSDLVCGSETGRKKWKIHYSKMKLMKIK